MWKLLIGLSSIHWGCITPFWARVLVGSLFPSDHIWYPFSHLSQFWVEIILVESLARASSWVTELCHMELRKHIICACMVGWEEKGRRRKEKKREEGRSSRACPIHVNVHGAAALLWEPAPSWSFRQPHTGPREDSKEVSWPCPMHQGETTLETKGVGLEERGRQRCSEGKNTAFYNTLVVQAG